MGQIVDKKVYESEAKANRYLGPRPEEGEGNSKNNKRAKNQLMKQFTKLEGPSGNSRAFQEGWERIFGGTLGSNE